VANLRVNEVLTGGQIVVELLMTHGVDTVFCVPGESYLPALDALYSARDKIRLIICRHEAAAANMAEAYGKLTGRPGVCFVTRGPGACHASIGLHTARQDSTPMLLLIGQVARGMSEREAFQEIDYRRYFGEVAKWIGQVDDAARLPEFLSRAFHTACNGRPGPVVLSLPEDMLGEVAQRQKTSAYRPAEAAPSSAQLASIQAAIEASSRPLLIIGGGGWSEQGRADIAAFARAMDLPVTCSFRRQDLFDNRDPNYVGHMGVGMDPGLARRIAQADLLLVVNARLGEMSTNAYTLVNVPRPAATLIHVHADPEELGRVYQADFPVIASPNAFAHAARKHFVGEHRRKWEEWRVVARQGFLDFSHLPRSSGPLDLSHAMAFLRKALPDDAIVANGAGNYTVWLHRFFCYHDFRTQLAPTSGAMGYGVPAAIAAKIVYPDRAVICLAGDGCFLMAGQELATAMKYSTAVVFIVVNNGMYGTIRMHQEKNYPERVVGTDLCNPDFAEYARSFGLLADRVETNAQFERSLAAALKCGKPALIELLVDPERITPTATIASLRSQPAAEAALPLVP
jgi:acetolactate synthase I/II/III large subunit